jgi:hypothetical protein
MHSIVHAVARTHTSASSLTLVLSLSHTHQLPLASLTPSPTHVRSSLTYSLTSHSHSLTYSLTMQSLSLTYVLTHQSLSLTYVLTHQSLSLTWRTHHAYTPALPARSFGCVPSGYGLKWACNVSSGWEGHPFTQCVTGAPHPLSTTRKNVLVIGDSVSNGYYLEADPGHNLPDLVADVADVQHAPWSPGSGGAGPTQVSSSVRSRDCMLTMQRMRICARTL